LREFYFTALGIVAAVVTLIDSLGEAVRKLPNNRSIIPLWKKHDIVILLNSEYGTKVENLVRNFDISTATLTAVTKNQDEIVSYFLSGYTRK